MSYVDEALVQGLFRQLRKASVPHVLLRNMGDEVPHRLPRGKDIDLLVKRDSRERLRGLMKEHFNMRPKDVYKGNYLYNMDPFDFFRDVESGFEVDVAYQLACRSPNRGEWVPLEISLQDKVWGSRIMTDDAPWESVLGREMEYIHLVCRCIFDKRKFAESYITRIECLKGELEIDDLAPALRAVFFGYTGRLLQLLKEGSYADLPEDYITFSDY